jgi:hypothetical protein
MAKDKSNNKRKRIKGKEREERKKVTIEQTYRYLNDKLT